MLPYIFVMYFFLAQNARQTQLTIEAVQSTASRGQVTQLTVETIQLSAPTSVQGHRVTFQ